MVAVLAYIPSPSSGNIGPFHAYGLMIALGVVVAVVVGERRWKARGGDPKDIGDIALWVVLAGVIGARVYHLFTGYDWQTGGITGTVEIWKGGLSIWGAVIGGGLALLIFTKVKHRDTLGILDAVAPAVLLAQAIGRFGNYFNQELFGGPTKLPWGLEIDPAHRPAGYARFATFHPTFLYEALWCVLCFGLIVLVERRFRVRKGQSVALYVALYCAGRFVFENIRIDKATAIFGVRFNAFVAAILCVAGAVWFVYLAKRGTPYPEGAAAAPEGTSAVGTRG